MPLTDTEKETVLMRLGYGEDDDIFVPDFIRPLTDVASARIRVILTDIERVLAAQLELVLCEVEADKIADISVNMTRKYNALTREGTKLMRELSSLTTVTIKNNPFSSGANAIVSVK